MSKKVVNKKNKKVIVIVMIIGIVIGLFLLFMPIKIFVHNDSSLEKIGVIEGKRNVYSYCVKEVLVFPPMNKKMSTKAFLKGTVLTGYVWDGGTGFNQGIGYVIVDCQDMLKHPRTSPVIVTTKECQDEAFKYCKSQD